MSAPDRKVADRATVRRIARRIAKRDFELLRRLARQHDHEDSDCRVCNPSEATS